MKRSINGFVQYEFICPCMNSIITKQVFCRSFAFFWKIDLTLKKVCIITVFYHSRGLAEKTCSTLQDIRNPMNVFWLENNKIKNSIRPTGHISLLNTVLVIQVHSRVYGDLPRAVFHTPYGRRPRAVWSTTGGKFSYTLDWSWITNLFPWLT